MAFRSYVATRLAAIMAGLALVAAPAAAIGDTAGAPTAQPGGAHAVALRHQAVVDDNVVRLDDIFDAEFAGLGLDPATTIAYAPLPGRRAVFDAGWLARVAYRHRLPWRPTTRLDRIIVERTSTAR